MTDQSTVAALLSTARVRFISTLVVIALLLGIATEGISIATASIIYARFDAKPRLPPSKPEQKAKLQIATITPKTFF